MLLLRNRIKCFMILRKLTLPPSGGTLKISTKFQNLKIFSLISTSFLLFNKLHNSKNEYYKILLNYFLTYNYQYLYHFYNVFLHIEFYNFFRNLLKVCKISDKLTTSVRRQKYYQSLKILKYFFIIYFTSYLISLFLRLLIVLVCLTNSYSSK